MSTNQGQVPSSAVHVTPRGRHVTVQPAGAPEALSGAVAVTASGYTYISNAGMSAGGSVRLPTDGVEDGQIKKVVQTSGTVALVITAVSGAQLAQETYSGSTGTFSAATQVSLAAVAGNFAVFKYRGNTWFLIESSGATVS